MSRIKHVKFIVTGRVQGVGFRYSTSRIAKELGLTGWVMNKLDGTVEIRVEGNRSALERFKQRIQEGNRFLKINNIEEEELYRLGEYKNFEIRFL
jgi:acylphosphatase